MALTKNNTKVTNIQELMDIVIDQSTTVKALFDKSNVDMKTYINDTLTVEIDAQFATKTELDIFATKVEVQGVVLGQIPDGTLTPAKLSFDPATQAELDAYTADNVKSLRSFGGVCDGVTDDYTAIMNAHTNLNDGDVLLIPGPTLFKTPIVWTKKANISCLGEKGYLIPDVGITNDAITVRGGVSALNNIDWNINIFGLANSCKNALVMDFVSLSTINAHIKTGAVEYGYVAKGCLLTTHNIVISTNYSVSLVGAIMPANHILLDTSAVVVTDSNACKFNVKLEGGGNGIVKTNANFLETVEFTGTIEGLTGKAFDINRARYININNIHMESNTQSSIFTDCRNVEIGSGVRNNTMKIDFVDTRGITIDGYSGSLEFNANCIGIVRQIAFEASDVIINNSKGVFIEDSISNLSSSILSSVASIGKNVPENLFHNPFVDIWSAGASAAPDGWSSATITWAKELVKYFPENPSKMAIYCQQTGITINDGARATLKTNTNMNSTRWISATIPIYVATGQPDVRVFIYDASQFRLVYTVTQKDQWVLVCGSALVDANQNIRVQVSPHNGTAYVAGNYYIGGLSAINGNIASKYLIDSGKRKEHVVDNIGFAPAFVGQDALLTATSKFYKAKGIASSADWIILN